MFRFLFIQGSLHSLNTSILRQLGARKRLGKLRHTEQAPALKSSQSRVRACMKSPLVNTVRATPGCVQSLLFQEAFSDCSVTVNHPWLEPYRSQSLSSRLVPCFLPGVIHFLSLPVSLGLYPKGTYHSVLHHVPINSNMCLY